MSRAVWVDGTILEDKYLEVWDARVERDMRITETAEAAVKAIVQGYGAEFQEPGEFLDYVRLVKSMLHDVG